MTDQLKAFISNYVSMDEAEQDYIAGLFKSRKLKKNEFLLEQGTVCSELVFVQEASDRLLVPKMEKFLLVVRDLATSCASAGFAGESPSFRH